MSDTGLIEWLTVQLTKLETLEQGRSERLTTCLENLEAAVKQLADELSLNQAGKIRLALQVSLKQQTE